MQSLGDQTTEAAPATLAKMLTPAQRRVLLRMTTDGTWWHKPGSVNYDMICRIDERCGAHVVEDNLLRASRFMEWRPTPLGVAVIRHLRGEAPSA